MVSLETGEPNYHRIFRAHYNTGPVVKAVIQSFYDTINTLFRREQNM
jgi:hypothetical protein